MIKSSSHRGLQRFFETGSRRGIQADHADRLRTRLVVLNQATIPQEMDIPGWRLHELTGNRRGCWSVKVSGNWRMTFYFENGDAVLVDYEDYH